jgi:hypothetical protein
VEYTGKSNSTQIRLLFNASGTAGWSERRFIIHDERLSGDAALFGAKE